MSAQKDRKTLTAITITMVLSAVIGATGTYLNRTSDEKIGPLSDSSTDGGVRPSEAPHASANLSDASRSGPTPSPDLEPSMALSEIMANDDACRLLELVKNERRSGGKTPILTKYLLTTPFRARFEEYSELLMGFEAPRTRFGTFYLGLAHAHWLENQGWKSPFQQSYGRAARILLELARIDSENAVPAAFALIAIEAALEENDPSLGISVGEKEEAIELLQAATKFDSYTLSYLTELANFDDQRSVSLLLRAKHLSELAIPNWNEFRSRWSQTQSLRQEEKLRIIDLIAANAQQAKKPSHHLGYSYLEHRFAQSLAGGARAYQTPEQIDSAFPSASQTNFETFMKDIKFLSPCPDPQSDAATAALRAYAKELRRTEAGLGVSF